MHMFATIALCLREGNKEFKEKDKEDLFFNHVIFFPLFIMMQVKLLVHERHLCSIQPYQPDSKVLIDDLTKAELGLKKLSDGLYFQKGWNRFTEITL